jgi:hypothetical protein
VPTQDPPDGKSLGVRTGVQKALTLQNTGTCAFPDGTLLVETLPADGSTPVSVTVPSIAPSATAVVSFDWPGRTSAGETVRVFELHAPNELVIGEPLTLTLHYLPAATPRPTATNTPALPTVTPTSAAAGLTDIYPAAYVGCAYQNNNMDYNCTVKLGWAGGSGRMTLYVDGLQIGAYNPGESIFYNIVSRRCLPKAYSLRLVDDGTLTQVSKDFFFDPSANGSLFPGGACTLPS